MLSGPALLSRLACRRVGGTVVAGLRNLSSHDAPKHALKLQPEQQRVSSFFPIDSNNTFATDFPLSEGNLSNIVLYDGKKVRGLLSGPQVSTNEDYNELASEWIRVLDSGPGVLVVKDAFPDHELLDQVTTAFEEIIKEEEEENEGVGDHFSAAGNNSRIWNAQEKLCVKNPALFIKYMNNPILTACSRSWLGPDFQVTSQVNSSHPGSAAQDPHCDYHLGFRSNEQVVEYPAHVHKMSQYLTLQGAIAHVDMPLESGPTTFLPYSQNFERNYLTWRDPQFIEYYKMRNCQLPLDKGDAVFFNPGLIHAAGDNLSENVDRLANLVQISSAFGQPMETLDRYRMCKAAYPSMLELVNSEGHGDPAHILAAIECTAFGNAFPTNLDKDTPQGSSPPPSQKDKLYEALMMKLTPYEFGQWMDAHKGLRESV